MPKWSVIAFLIATVLVVAWYGNISSGALLGDDDMSSLNALMTFNIFDVGWDISQGWSGIQILNPDWVNAWSVNFDYPMFDGDYAQYIQVGLMVMFAAFFVIGGTWLVSVLRG